MPKDLSLHLISLGCNKNLVDAEVMLAGLKDFTYTQDLGRADLIIINTCGFIESAKQESINTILNAHAARKGSSTLLVAGCLSERYKKELQMSMPEVDIFTGLGDYGKIAELVRQKKSRFSRDVFLIDKEERQITGSTSHAYIKISEGCNQSCSFCAIPNFRGRLKSRTIASCADEVRRLVDRGFYDFSFISQDSSSYLFDKKESAGLARLVEQIEKIPGVLRARVLYLYPSSLNLRLIDTIINSPVFESYFDIPLQHISDRMLKIMKRGLGERSTRKLIDYIRSKGDVWLRTAFIVGHPGETDADFQSLARFAESGSFDMMSVFEYSKEEDTPAFFMRQTDKRTVKKRLGVMQEILENNRARVLSGFVGKTLKASITPQTDEFFLNAKNLAFAPEIDPEILINESAIEHLTPGKLVNVKITAALKEELLGKVVDD